MAIGDAHALPFAVHSEPASPAELKLVGATLGERLVDELPRRLIADRAYDSDPLRGQLLQEEVLLIVPHRRGRTRPRVSDGTAAGFGGGAPPASLYRPSTVTL